MFEGNCPQYIHSVSELSQFGDGGIEMRSVSDKGELGACYRAKASDLEARSILITLLGKSAEVQVSPCFSIEIA